jgi:hypothetical protein
MSRICCIGEITLHERIRQGNQILAFSGEQRLPCIEDDRNTGKDAHIILLASAPSLHEYLDISVILL